MIAPKGYTTASSPWSGSKLFARSSNGTPVSRMITGHYRQMLRIELDEDKLVAVIVFVASLPLNTIPLALPTIYWATDTGTKIREPFSIYIIRTLLSNPKTSTLPSTIYIHTPAHPASRPTTPFAIIKIIPRHKGWMIKHALDKYSVTKHLNRVKT